MMIFLKTERESFECLISSLKKSIRWCFSLLSSPRGVANFFLQHEGDEKRGMNLHFFTKNCKEDSREKSERD